MTYRYRWNLLLLILLSCLSLEVAAQQGQAPFQLICSDGFKLDGIIHHPSEGQARAVPKVIILLHGSGPQSMDSDFTAITKEKKSNLFFKEISSTLAYAGFIVIRYHKRSYQANMQRQRDPAFLQSDQFRAYAENPLKYFVEDAQDAVRYAEATFPGAQLFLLGHSQGAYIALQVAHLMPQVKGVALIGYAASSTETLFFEQTVYRPLSLFQALDVNQDRVLDAAELDADTPVAATLRSQKAILDLDTDGTLSQIEFQAGNLSNLFIRDLLGPLREQEARYPRTADILASANFKVAFFQGLWDNQTPAYNTKAVELVVKQVWKKDNFRFFYFQKLGHALDPRTSYDDLQYDTIAPDAKGKLAEELSLFF